MKGYKINYIVLTNGPGMSPRYIGYNSKEQGTKFNCEGKIKEKQVVKIIQPFQDVHAYDVIYDDGSAIRYTKQVIEVSFDKEPAEPDFRAWYDDVDHYKDNIGFKFPNDPTE